MSYATDDAEMFGAREFLYLCRGKLLGEFRQEKSCGWPDVQRLADPEGMLDQVREDIRAVQVGDRPMITRAPYALWLIRPRMVRTGVALTGCIIAG